MKNAVRLGRIFVVAVGLGALSCGSVTAELPDAGWDAAAGSDVAAQGQDAAQDKPNPGTGGSGGTGGTTCGGGTTCTGGASGAGGTGGAAMTCRDPEPGAWEGCRGQACGVCSELIADYPLYTRLHPGCTPTLNCAGLYFSCSPDCPAPTAEDTCDLPGDGWNGCRGLSCAVCPEKLVGYPRYLDNHPRCIVNPSCEGQFFGCNAECPAPTDADR